MAWSLPFSFKFLLLWSMLNANGATCVLLFTFLTMLPVSFLLVENSMHAIPLFLLLGNCTLSTDEAY